MNADYLTRDVSDFAIVKAAARHLAEWKQGVLESLRQDRHLLLCAGAYYAGALVFLAATGNLGLWQTSMSRSALLPELPYLLIAAALAVRAFAKGDLRSFLSPVRTAQGFTVLLLYSLLHPLFFAVKGSIWYRIKDSGWDSTFTKVDSTLHGAPPGPVLIDAMSDLAIRAVDGWYLFGWWSVIAVTLTAAAWGVRRGPRRRLVASYIGAWAIAGNALAWLFASAGPCYAEAITGATTYRPLVDRLAEVSAVTPLTARLVQRYLFACTGTAGCWGSGISAMPSVHLVLATITALYWSGFGRVQAFCGVFFVLSILFGSIVLGWHYAIDGYAGIALGTTLWVATRPLAREDAPARSEIESAESLSDQTLAA